MAQNPNRPNNPAGTPKRDSGFETVKIDQTAATAASGTAQGQQGQSATQEIVDRAQQATGEVIDQAKETVVNVADQAREQVTSRLSNQKHRAAEGLGTVAETLRQTSSQLREQNQDVAHEYVTKAADQVERLSTYLNHHEISDIVGEVEQFARRQPALFLGGSFLLGLLGARFLKSSAQATQNTGANYNYNYPAPRMPAYRQQPVYRPMPTNQSYGQQQPQRAQPYGQPQPTQHYGQQQTQYNQSVGQQGQGNQGAARTAGTQTTGQQGQGTLGTTHTAGTQTAGQQTQGSQGASRAVGTGTQTTGQQSQGTQGAARGTQTGTGSDSRGTGSNTDSRGGSNDR